MNLWFMFGLIVGFAFGSIFVLMLSMKAIKQSEENYEDARTLINKVDGQVRRIQSEITFPSKQMMPGLEPTQIKQRLLYQMQNQLQEFIYVEQRGDYDRPTYHGELVVMEMEWEE